MKQILNLNHMSIYVFTVITGQLKMKNMFLLECPQV